VPPAEATGSSSLAGAGASSEAHMLDKPDFKEAKALFTAFNVAAMTAGNIR